MQRKILDVWPRLMRPIRAQGSQNEEANREDERGDDGSHDDEQQSDELDEAELLEVYKNLYWT